jgi:hypothetical protein
MTEPVDLDVSAPAAPRNRPSVLLRPLLSLPHVLLVGGAFVGIIGGYRAGALAFLAGLIAIFDWVSILIAGHPVAGLQDLKRLYLHWRARALVYYGLLRDEYPPFGEGPYPAMLILPEPPVERDRLMVALRPLLVIPHLLYLAILFLAWLAVTIYAWVYLLVAARHPPGAWRFIREVTRYALRVEAYLLLVHDRFPSFAFIGGERAEPVAPAPQPG